MADLIGKTAEAVSNIERGLSLPTLLTLVDIAQVLHVPLSALVGELATKTKKAPKRLALELKLQAASEGLNDQLLEIAIKLVSALSDLKR